MCALRISTGVRNKLLDGTGGYGTGGLKQLFEAGAMDIYSGTPPSNADAAETGVLLVRITIAAVQAGSGGTGGGTAGTGLGTAGLQFGTAANGVMTKAADVWSGTATSTGVAGWWRFYDTRVLKGTSGTAVRMDGNCAVSGGDLTMSSLTVTKDVVTTIDSFQITLPAY